MNVGIFFGGPSRERETSFAIARTVFDKMDRALFEPVLLFVDSYGQLVRLKWGHLYKRAIRDFFPPVEEYAGTPPSFSIYQESLGERSPEEQEALLQKIGQPLAWEKLPYTIDIGFNAYLGLLEDGQLLPERLRGLKIPCTGSDAKAIRMATDKVRFGEALQLRGFATPARLIFSKEKWKEGSPSDLYQEAIEALGFPLQVQPARHANAASSSLLKESGGLEGFETAVNRAFFREVIPLVEWQDRDAFEREEYIRLMTGLRDGLGFPIRVEFGEERRTFARPKALLDYLNERAEQGHGADVFLLESQYSSDQVVLEAQVKGRAFSCTVLELEDKRPLALLPAALEESRPSAFDAKSAQRIRTACAQLFQELEMQVYAEAEGLITEEGEVYVTDWHPVLYLVPGNPVFAQVADLSLSPTALLTFMLRASIDRLPEAERSAILPEHLEKLDTGIDNHRARVEKATVLLDRLTLDRPAERLSSQHIFELLDAAVAYAPSLAQQSGHADSPAFHWVPLRMLYGSTAEGEELAPILAEMRASAASIIQRYSNQLRTEPEATRPEDWAEEGAVVFIAGEEQPAWLRRRLATAGLPYSGSRAPSSELGADRYKLLQTLEHYDFIVPTQLLLRRQDFEQHADAFFQRIESLLDYPLLASPANFSGKRFQQSVEKRSELEAYVRLLFRPEGEAGAEARRSLGLRAEEAFPRSDNLLLENRITRKGAKRFFAIEGGLLTHYEADGSLRYEMFDPAEQLPKPASRPHRLGAYLTANGCLLTPARFSELPEEQRAISAEVKKELERAARILDLQAYASLKAFVRVYEDNSVDTIITDVDTLPSLAAGHSFFQQAVYRGYTPETLVRAILVFGQDRKYYAKGARRRQKEYPTPTASAAASVANQSTTPAPSTSPEEASPSATGQQKALQPQSMGDYLKERGKAILAEIGKFFKNGFVLRNLIGIIFMLVLSIWMVRWSLDLYTNHGESIQIPDYTGMDVRDARRKAEKQDFKIIVIDSFFDSRKRPNVIYQQNPEPLQRAKEGRTIYVSKYRVLPDSVTLPTLISASYNYEQYSTKLKRRDIKSKIRKRVFSRDDEPNSIKYIIFNGRKITDDMLRRGVKVPKGATLEFVVTERITGTVPIPDLVCKRYDAAAFLLSGSNLVIKETIGAEGNEENAYVYKQEPAFEPGKMVPNGSAVTLYLSSSRPPSCPEENNTLPENVPEEGSASEEDFNQ